MPTAWKPRAPSSLLSLFSVVATRMQCGDLTKRNSNTTTLPLKLESCVVLPEASAMVNSGDLRSTVTVGRANADVASTADISMDVIFRLLIYIPPGGLSIFLQRILACHRHHPP